MVHHHRANSTYDIGFKEALSITLGALPRMSPVTLPVEEVCDRVVAEDLFATVDCPSATSSLKDGYAVVSKDIEAAPFCDTKRLLPGTVHRSGASIHIKSPSVFWWNCSKR